MSDNNHKIAVGTLIGDKYRIDGIIGEGGMGTVYEATHTAINRTVAIKCLHPECAKEERAIRRFRQEAEIAGSLGHDNICEVTDVGALPDGSPFLVMPYLKGASLSVILKNEAPLDPVRAVDIIAQTLSALSAAHEAQIVHRDLKPDNLFVTRFGDRDDFVKLLDFGISKVMRSSGPLEVTRQGTVLGTPFYMSPEQAGGSKSIDHRSDIYAVGIILYQSLTGSRPFEGETYNEVIAKILTEPFPSPRSLNPDISRGLERVVLKAMARDPLERYTSASQMREALLLASTQSDADISVDTAEATLSETLQQLAVEASSRRHRISPAVLGAVILGFTILVVYGIYDQYRADKPTVSSTPKAETARPAAREDVPSNASPLPSPPRAGSADTAVSVTDDVPATSAPEKSRVVTPNDSATAILPPRRASPIKRARTKRPKRESVDPTPTPTESTSTVIKGRQGTIVVSDYE